MRLSFVLSCLLMVLLAGLSFAQEADSAKTLLPPGMRVRIEYKSAREITVGTLVRGGPDTLIVRPESVLRDARFLTKDVRDFAWWYPHPRLSTPGSSQRGGMITIAVVGLSAVALIAAAGDTGIPGELIVPIAVPAGLVLLGGTTYIALHLIAPGGEWVHQPLTDVRFAHATTHQPGTTVALTLRR